METTISKVDCIHISNAGEWATFLIDKWTTGPGFSLTVQSSFGTWGYGWGRPGESVAEFLADVYPDYVATKFRVEGNIPNRQFSQFWRMFWNPFIEAVKNIKFTSRAKKDAVQTN